jgi:hypothetical protein
MEATEPVKNLFRGFHQDMFEYAQTPEAIAREALGFLTAEDVPAVVSYLDDLLGGRYTDDEIQKIWNEMPADIYFVEASAVVKILTLVHDLLKSNTYFKLSS